MSIVNNSSQQRTFGIVIFVLLFMGACILYNSVSFQQTFTSWSHDATAVSLHLLNAAKNQLSFEEMNITATIPSLNKENKRIQEEPQEYTSLPDALQPVTFEGCCPSGPNRFVQTCLTEEACNNTLYPFSSQEEVAMFRNGKPARQALLLLRKRCQDANDQLQPPHNWCSNNNNSNSSFPMGCSHFSMAGGSGPYDRVLLFPTGKLAFCGIPKAGITQWLQFLRFTLGAKDYQSMPYYKGDVNPFYLDKLQPHVQNKIWNGWTKAVLIREPAERLLSAYLDKVAPPKRPISQNYTRPNHQHRRRLGVPFGPNVTFADFVDILAMPNISRLSDEYRGFIGISWYTDPHWRPQAWSCGLSEHMPSFDYIGSLDRAAFHTKTLLEQVNMWETFGRHYRVSAKGKEKGPLLSKWPPPPLEPGETAAGFQQEGANDNDRHNQYSKNKLDKYYTPELMKKVRELYWMDFKLWDALQEAEKEGLFRGKDIVQKLNPNCQ